MKMTMTADEVKAFMDRIHADLGSREHTDYIGFIVGATYRDNWGGHTYKVTHRTPCYVTFEATGPWQKEPRTFRSKVRICGDGSGANVGWLEDCKSPYRTPMGEARICAHLVA